MAWVAVILFVASLVISYSMQPKPETRPPAGLGDFKAPTAEVGREIPVLFGQRKIESANVVWYGDLRVTPITKKVKK